MKETKNRQELRPVEITTRYLRFAEGSALIHSGNTRVLAAASVHDKVPAFLKGTGEGWITAEYALLPRSTPERNVRERGGRYDPRSLEISRTIGRALRGSVDLSAIGEYTVFVDCDVIQADGGTRTAAITAGFCALYDAFRFMLEQSLIEHDPVREFLAAVSVGLVGKELVLDLSYGEDVRAAVDLNVVMTESGNLVDVQGTGEKRSFTGNELNEMLALAWKGIEQLIRIQKDALEVNRL
jgi:ribonuclease PH